MIAQQNSVTFLLKATILQRKLSLKNDFCMICMIFQSAIITYSYLLCQQCLGVSDLCGEPSACLVLQNNTPCFDGKSSSVRGKFSIISAISEHKLAFVLKFATDYSQRDVVQCGDICGVIIRSFSFEYKFLVLNNKIHHLSLTGELREPELRAFSHAAVGLQNSSF